MPSRVVRPLANPKREVNWNKVAVEAVYAMVVHVWATKGRSPSTRELAYALRVATPSTVLPYLERLVQDGKLETEHRDARTWYWWPAGTRKKVMELFADPEYFTLR